MVTHLSISRVCSHTREVEFDSQHTPSSSTMSWLSACLAFNFRVLTNGFWFLACVAFKLSKLEVESPNFVENCQNLLTPRVFVKMSAV